MLAQKHSTNIRVLEGRAVWVKYGSGIGKFKSSNHTKIKVLQDYHS